MSLLDKIKTQIQNLIGLANEKTGNSDTDLTTAVTALIEGYGNEISEPVYSEYDDVCFWDYDGTLLYSCTLEEAKVMTELPEVPDHSKDDIPLTFEEWNWTLEEINSLDRKANIGAMYSPTDGNTHMFFRLVPRSGLTVTLKWYNRSSDSTLTFDWGDGIVETYTHGSMAAVTYGHTYSDYGTYHCKINPNGLRWNPNGINETTGASILVDKLVFDKFATWDWPGAQGASAFRYANIETCILPYELLSLSGQGLLNECFYLKHLNVPKNIEHLMGIPQKCRRMKHISLPSCLKTIADYGLAGFSSMEEIRLPKGCTLGTSTYSTSCRFMFMEDYSLKKIDIPYGRAVIDMREYAYCYNLKTIDIPDTINTIRAEAFSNSGIMDYYFHSITPPTLDNVNAFTNIRAGTIIHVPANSLEEYQNATNWTTYALYMVGDL